MPIKKISKQKEKEVCELYLDGKMGPEIANQLDLSLKQVYGALRRNDVPRKRLWEQNKIIFERKEPSFNFKTTLTKREREILIAAIMLYYGEGAKTGTTVDFANSDYRMVKLFVKFLREICVVKEKKLRFYLYCFSDQNPNDIIRFWSSLLNVQRSQFTKPYIRSALNNGKRKMQHGVIHVRYSDKKLLNKILSICHNLIEQLDG